MKKIVAILMVMGLGASVNADLIISQYVDTDSGTHPKGIELWNSGESSIDFSTDNLDVEKGTNGDTPSSVFTLNTGSLAAGAVMVIGSDESGDPLFDYMESNYPTVAYFRDASFTHNGDDAFQVKLDGVITDIFGNPGSDPGDEWVGNGVSTQDQNIQLKEGADLITEGDAEGWTDPSIRFTTVSTSPTGSGGLEGFGVSPIPEPTTFALFAALGAFGLLRRRLFRN